MIPQLWPHQQAAADKLAPLGRGMLWLDMGCGKSRTALSLVARWGCRRVLILCPKSVVAVWPSEFAKAGLDWQVCALGGGTVPARLRAMQAGLLCAQVDGKPVAVVLNYDSIIHGQMPLALLTAGWDCLILDEIHRLKAHRGKQQEVALNISRRVHHKLGLTGTPMPHSPTDVFSQFRIIDPHVLGWDYRHFEDRVVVWGPERKTKEGRKFREIEGYQNLSALQRRMDPHVYRVASDDVLQLPDAVDVQRTCLLAPKAQRIYHDLEADLIAQIDDGEVNASNALTKLLRLAQVANGFAQVTTGEERTTQQVGTEKAELLAEILDDLPAEEPIVVFCRFHEDLDTVHRISKAAGRGSCELSGRRNDLADWQAGKTPIIAVQLQSGGVGVDLTRARYAVYFALDFNMGSYLQTRKRVHRPGQTRSVVYIHLIAAGTVDEQIMGALERREEVVGAILSGMTARAKSRSSKTSKAALAATGG